MTTTSTTIERGLTAASASRTADAAFAALAGWLMTGVYLDAWAHTSRLPDPFWTPWHGILYSGMLACIALLAGARVLERRSGREILGPGYAPALVGAAISALGGVADAVWHTIFGIEFGIDAAVSPSHLLLVAGIFLLVSGPVRAAWRSPSRAGTAAVLSLTYMLAILAVITSYAQPFSYVAGAGGVSREREGMDLEQVRAIFSFAVYAALLAGLVLFAMRRMALRPAHLAAIVVLNATALALESGPVIGALQPVLLAAALAGGALVALAAAVLRPSAERPGAFYAFAFLLPALPSAAYAVAVVAAAGTAWTATFWLGLVAIAGLVGVLIAGATAPARSAEVRG